LLNGSITHTFSKVFNPVFAEVDVWLKMYEILCISVMTAWHNSLPSTNIFGFGYNVLTLIWVIGRPDQGRKIVAKAKYT
jgi:hypothetical protein